MFTWVITWCMMSLPTVAIHEAHYNYVPPKITFLMWWPWPLTLTIKADLGIIKVNPCVKFHDCTSNRSVICPNFQVACKCSFSAGTTCFIQFILAHRHKVQYSYEIIQRFMGTNCLHPALMCYTCLGYLQVQLPCRATCSMWFILIHDHSAQ